MTTPPDTSAAPASAHELELPWWQHPVNIVTMLVTVGVLAGMLGWLIGDAREDGVVTSDADIGFLQDMRVHHEQAVEMSNLFLDPLTSIPAPGPSPAASSSARASKSG